MRLDAGFVRVRVVFFFAMTLVLGGGGVACERNSRWNDRSKDGGVAFDEASAEFSRAEVVSYADLLSYRAERGKGETAKQDYRDAAKLRERIWRLERRKVDALEAIELFSEAGKRGDCSSRIRSLALRAEIEADWAPIDRELNEVEQADRSPMCQSSVKTLRMISGRQERYSAVIATTKPSEAKENQGSNVVIPTIPEGTHRGLPRISRVERYGAKDAARIVVMISEPTTYRAGLLRANEGGTGSRIYVDIDGAELGTVDHFEVGGLVQRVRLGKQPGGVRLVLDLEEAAERHIFYVPEPFRLVIDVARGANVRKLAAQGPRVIERVVIDPGHGGHDPGAIGPRGLREKDVTLDIAHRAGPLIARELGLSTLLTRDTDVYVALDERTARANAFRADLFVSIHCNAAEQTGSDGVVTFVLDSSSDVGASRIAAIENAASAAAASELASSIAPVQDEGVLTRSLHFAELLQRSTVASLSKDYGTIPNQGVRRAGFYVLAGAHMPAVLYEVSFISNPDGEVRLNTADYRQRLADSIVNAVRAFRDGL